jgi:O-antigen/teichoic acid export membrane protein
VVRLLYGGQWDEAIPLVRVLCIGELFLVPFYLFPHLLISHGFVKSESLRIGLFTVIRAVPLVVLAHLELVVVASGYAAMSFLGFAISLAIAQKKFGIGLAEIWRATRSSLGVAVLSGTASGAVVLGFPPETNGLAAGLAAATSASLGGWLLGLILFRHPIVNEISLAINSGMRRRRRSSGD